MHKIKQLLLLPSKPWAVAFISLFLAGMMEGCSTLPIVVQKEQPCVPDITRPIFSKAMAFDLKGRWHVEPSAHQENIQGYFNAFYTSDPQELSVSLMTGWLMPIAEITHAQGKMTIQLSSGRSLNESEWEAFSQQQLGMALPLPIADWIHWIQGTFTVTSREETGFKRVLHGTSQGWMLEWRGIYVCEAKAYRLEWLSMREPQGRYRLNLEIDQKESVWK
jgi:outer membrane biogenesis lipoprotein LolB